MFSRSISWSWSIYIQWVLPVRCGFIVPLLFNMYNTNLLWINELFIIYTPMTWLPMLFSSINIITTLFIVCRLCICCFKIHHKIILTITLVTVIITRAVAHVSGDNKVTLSAMLTRICFAVVVYCNINNMKITLHWCFTRSSLNSEESIFVWF